MATDWTKSRIKTVTRMWLDGDSARRIGKHLGVSANAVIGKLHRLGVKRRPSASTRAVGPARAKRPPVAAVAPAAPIVRRLPEPPAVVTPKTLLDLDPIDCRWPVGDYPYRFCAAPKIDGGAYCGHHRAMAFESGSRPRKQRVERDFRVVRWEGSQNTENATSDQENAMETVS